MQALKTPHRKALSGWWLNTAVTENCPCVQEKMSFDVRIAKYKYGRTVLRTFWSKLVG